MIDKGNDVDNCDDVLRKVGLRKLFINMIFAFAIVAAAVMFYLYSTQSSYLERKNVIFAQAGKIIGQVNEIRQKMKDHDGRLSAYLVDGDPVRMQGWTEQARDIQSAVTTLNVALKQHPTVYDGSRLSSEINEQLSEMNRLYDLKHNDILLASDAKQYQVSKQLAFDKLNHLIDSLIVSEKEYFQMQNSLVNPAPFLGSFNLLYGALISLSLLMLCGVLFNVELRRREHRTQENEYLRSSNQSLYEDMQSIKDSNEKITLLLEMSDIMLSANDLNELSDIIAKYCLKVLNFNNGLLYVMHPTGNFLEAGPKWGNPHAHASHFMLDQCWSLRTGHIHEATIGETELMCDHVKERLSDGYFYLCIPLHAKNDVYGLLYVESVKVDKDYALSRNERSIIYAFAEVAALGFANMRLRESLLYQSVRDPLTSLYNRRYLAEFLTKQIYQSERSNSNLAVIMIDVDHFKHINDHYGHDAGDAVLKELSQLFLNYVRPGDIAARYGGEEFVIVLYEIDAASAKNRAEMLRHEASILVVQYGAQLIGSITVSVGVAMYPDDGVSSTELLEAADKALYFAKHGGRNKVAMFADINGIAEIA